MSGAPDVTGIAPRAEQPANFTASYQQKQSLTSVLQLINHVGLHALQRGGPQTLP